MEKNTLSGVVKHFKKMGMLKLVDRSRLGRGEINSYKFESYYP